MNTIKNMVFCSILFASIYSYAMQYNNANATLTQEQAETIKNEARQHLFRDNEKFYCMNDEVLTAIENNEELNDAFKKCKNYIHPPETKESQFIQFKMIVNSLVKSNQ
ncbi:MAG TPA: hypothetical protein VLB80_03120 [Candidatus Babeliales bacterium]|nr:hypothetical protein [Candidatus Babeliales bacterium]